MTRPAPNLRNEPIQPGYPTQATIRRTVKAVTKLGLDAKKVTVSPTGEVSVFTELPPEGQDSGDEWV